MAGVFKTTADDLDAEVRRFPQKALGQTLFLNSVPKAGTHLLRNILRMFVPPEQHYHYNFVQIASLRDHPEVFIPEKRYLSCGHLLFADVSVQALGTARHILLVRDPYDVALARARHYLSEAFQSPGLAHLKSGEVPVGELLNLMILGIHQKAAPLREIYLHNALAWRGTNAVMIRYEDVQAALADLRSGPAERFFAALLANCGIEASADWRERVRVGADRRHSPTARENLRLSTTLTIPEQLPRPQRELFDYTAPGLRTLLGYS